MNESIHGESTASEPQDRVTALIEQRTVISEVLRAIANSLHELQPIFDAILDSATRLRRADIGGSRIFPKKAAFDARRCEEIPSWLVRRSHHFPCCGSGWPTLVGRVGKR
jgi:hypothetical protein